MKSISVKRELWKDLKELSNDKESMDKTVRRLLREVGDNMGGGVDKTPNYRTNINISDDTHRKLRKHKLYETEPLAQVLARAVALYNLDDD